jgi:histone arginine demethylase JMJD6
VVITGALENWRARAQWTPDFFRQRHVDIPLHVENQPYTLGGFLPRRDDGKPLTLSEFIDLVLASTEENPAPYLRNVHIDKFLPELNAVRAGGTPQRLCRRQSRFRPAG